MRIIFDDQQLKAILTTIDRFISVLDKFVNVLKTLIDNLFAKKGGEKE